MPRIAVVNDDTAFLDLMSQMLEMEGYETRIVREANAAFPQLREWLPDLVILDIRMDAPENGWTICELLKLDPSTSTIPIIICSAAILELREKAGWLEQHNVGVLPKPFDLDDLYECVKVALETGRPMIKGL
jgi:CheY-like chemotaxis protein